MTPRTIQRWVVMAVSAVLLAGCSAVADESGKVLQSSSALRDDGHGRGGVLACSGKVFDGNSNQYRTWLFFSNDNDEGTISIDRILVYSRTGQVMNDVLDPAVLGPHQGAAFTPTGLPTSPGGPAGQYRFVVYWSHAKGLEGAVNPLDGYSETSIFNIATGTWVTRMPRECKAVALSPKADKCSRVTCKTKEICGQQAQCEVCVDGKCVPNTPHFDAACVPSCGAANSLCGTAGICNFPNGQCVPTPTWDCWSCCTEP